MFISCKSASRLISQSLDAPLKWQDRVALRVHLMICRHCTRFSQQLAKLRIAVSSMVRRVEDDTNVQLNPEVKVRIANAMKSDE